METIENKIRQAAAGPGSPTSWTRFHARVCRPLRAAWARWPPWGGGRLPQIILPYPQYKMRLSF
jgi:hypothetical protein